MKKALTYKEFEKVWKQSMVVGKMAITNPDFNLRNEIKEPSLHCPMLHLYCRLFLALYMFLQHQREDI